MKPDGNEERRNRKMKRDNIALLALFLLAIMAFSLVPVKAFIYPDDSVDELYEDFGPRLDRIQVIMYPGLDAMWTGLQNGEIDVTDWPLTPAWLTTFTTPPYNETVKVTNYGGEAGFYTIDFNKNNNSWLGNPPNPAYPNPVATPPYQNPASDLYFRRAVSHLFNRIVYNLTIQARLGVMIYTPVPSYLGSPNPGEGIIHQEIRLGGALEAYTYPYSGANAVSNLTAGKFKIVPGQNSGFRFWDRNDNNICDPGEDVIIIFNYRADPGRSLAAQMLIAELGGPAINFRVDGRQLTGAQDYQYTMLDKNYHMATFGWTGIGPDPDFLYDLYHSSSYWHDPYSVCPNTGDLNDTILDYWAESIKFNETAEGARLSAWKFQERFAELAAQIPLFSYDGYKAHSRTYVGGTPEEAAYVGNNWLGLCNQRGFGDNGWYSFENAHPNTSDFGDGSYMTIRYGWSEDGYPQLINPLYSECYWDREVLNKIYDTLGHRDPYALNWEPYLIQNWTVGIWLDGGVEKSKVRITLRPDIRWADGYPVTVDDVIYSLTEVGHRLVDLGYPPPWSWPTTMQVRGAYAIDPYNIEILFKVKSFLAQSWALGGFYIIPKHVWQRIVEIGNPTDFAPDPDVIGSGPWRYVSMTTGASLLMVANKPGSVVTTDLPGAEAVTSPGVFNYYPVDTQAYEKSYLVKFPPDSDLEFHVKLNNLWTGTLLITPLTVDKYVTIKRVYPPGPLNGTIDQIITSTLGIVLAPNTPHEELFDVDNAYAGKIHINVTIVYQTAPFVGLTRTVIEDPWITIPEDIAGAILPGSNPPYPVPDFKVDGRDIAVASKAFGTRPGDPRWSPIADITGDYKIDGKDLARIAKRFGWHA
jgi:ABC-type transport system substrate-binding protein